MLISNVYISLSLDNSPDSTHIWSIYTSEQLLTIFMYRVIVSTVASSIVILAIDTNKIDFSTFV